MNKQGPPEREDSVHQLWIGEKDRVASFHRVEGYQQTVIRGQTVYLEFLRQLQEQGYRFQ